MASLFVGMQHTVLSGLKVMLALDIDTLSA
jgi:hypothetical protein